MLTNLLQCLYTVNGLDQDQDLDPDLDQECLQSKNMILMKILAGNITHNCWQTHRGSSFILFIDILKEKLLEDADK